MRIVAIFALTGFLACCAHKVAVPAEGPVLKGVPAQAIEQCQAQPNFPGCNAH